jgi:hypothetical protein
MHVYHYAGNNPVIITDPDGSMNWKQFARGAFQFVAGLVELGVGAGTATITVGGSTFVCIWGAKDVADGIITMYYAANDIQYSGFLPTIAGEVAVRVIGVDESNRGKVESAIAVLESFVGGRTSTDPRLISTVATLGGLALGADDIYINFFSNSGRISYSSSTNKMSFGDVYNQTIDKIRRDNQYGSPTSLKSAEYLKGLLSSALNILMEDAYNANYMYYYSLLQKLDEL